MEIPCFLIVPTGRIMRACTRTRISTVCSGNKEHSCYATGYDVPANTDIPFPAHSIPDYAPANCKHCGSQLDAIDGVITNFWSPEYKRIDTGETFPFCESPVGAIWHEKDLDDIFTGPDGKCYAVNTPGGKWYIDRRASNCTLPNDNVHKCWIRHGEAPNFTVDKNGHTCSAGAGSIQIGNYHGFLRNGVLIDA